MMNYSFPSWAASVRLRNAVGKSLLTMLLSVLTLSSWAQDKQVSGKIKDATGTGMPGVSVAVKGTQRGANTDVDGNYKIAVPENATLVFSFVGYKGQEVAVGGRSVVDVTLAEDNQVLNEVVVVGYGTQKRKEISGTVSSVSSKEFNAGVIANPLSAVQGKVAGLTINQTGSDPNAAPTVRLRGIGSLAAGSDPLYVVDGVPGVPIQNIDVNDIASVDVLRDASSAAIYGARASNGVILITTKRGKSGKASLDYNAYVGVDMVAKAPDYMNATEYRDAAKKLGFTLTNDQGADTDWFGAITQRAMVQSHNIGFGGGTENFSYRASIGYLGQQGLIKNSGLERLSARINLDQTALNGKLKIATSLSVINSKRNYADYDAFTFAITNLPTDPIYTDNPAFQTPSGILAGTRYFERLGEFSIFNPVARLEQTTNKGDDLEYLANVNMKYSLTDDLVFGINTATKGISQYGTYYTSRIPKGGEAQNGTARQTLNATNTGVPNNILPPPTRDNLLELTLNYNKTIDKLNFGVLGGYSYQDVTFQGFGAQNNNFITDGLSYNNLGAGAGVALGQRANDAVFSYQANFKLVSFFGRGTVSLDNKYFATVTVRRDGSTKFGANNKWGLFPSVSAGWTLSEEAFLKGNPTINNLKLRVNYGTTGNSEGINPYTSLALLGPGDRYFDNGNWLPSYRPVQNPNPDLKWEVNTSYGAGIDFSLLNYRITGSLDYYVRNTSDLLYNVDAPLSIKPLFPTILANVGTMRNQGLELTLNAGIIDKGDFRYDATLAFSTLKNEITALSKGDFIASDKIFLNTGLGAVTRGTSQVPFSLIKVGLPVGAFFGGVVTGLDDKGQYIFKDINGDGKINENDADRDYIGNPNPSVMASLTNNFSYKNFSLSFLLNGQFGNKIFNSERMLYLNPNNRLPAENTLREAATSPVRDTKTGAFDYFVEDGSFVRLANFRLGYQIPGKGVLSRAQVYISGNNLFVLTKFKGVDPEMNTGLATAGIYTKQQFPRARGFQVGFNLSF
jgi:TonB-dependent starch-binding outer membrane protein SusC